MTDARDAKRWWLPSFRDAPIGWALFYLFAYESVSAVGRHVVHAWAQLRGASGIGVLIILAFVAYVLAWMAWHRYGRAKPPDEVTSYKKRAIAFLLLGGCALLSAANSSYVAWRGWRMAQSLRPAPYTPPFRAVHDEAVDIYHRSLLMFVLPDALRAAFCAAGAVTMFFLWRGAMRALRCAQGYCQEYGYNLTGNVSGRCPECGTTI